MKRSKFDSLQLTSKNVLTREHLKNVYGGVAEVPPDNCRDSSQCGYQQACTIINYGTSSAYGKCCGLADFTDCKSVCSGDYCKS